MGGWTDEDLVAFADDAIVVALDLAALPGPLPPVLAGRAAADQNPQIWSNMLRLVHRADRGRVVRAWWRSHQSPAVVIECEVVTEVPGPQHRRQCIRFANLLDDPRVGAILLAVVDLGEIVEPEDRVPPTTGRIESPAWTLSTIDRVGNILDVDGMVSEIYGRTAAELEGRNVMDTVHPDAQDTALELWLEVVAEPGSSRSFQHRTQHPDGTALWIESTVMSRLDDDGTGTVVILSHDIEGRRRELAALRDSQDQFRMLAEDAPAGVFRANRWGRVEYGNARWHELLGDLGPVERLHDLVHPDHRARFSERWSTLFRGPAPDEPEVLEIRTAKGDRVLSLSCRVAGAGASEDGRQTIIGAMHDTTAATELRYRADHDSLTGLLNRRAFDRRLFELLNDGPVTSDAAAGDEPSAEDDWALFFVDLDAFKPVNDEHGHDIGDVVLRTIGQRLRAALRPDDVVARYGGDEFVALCLAVPEGGEALVVDRMSQVLEAPIEWDGGSWTPRASIGVARARPGDGPAAVLRRADEAMYEVKREH